MILKIPNYFDNAQTSESVQGKSKAEVGALFQVSQDKIDQILTKMNAISGSVDGRIDHVDLSDIKNQVKRLTYLPAKGVFGRVEKMALELADRFSKSLAIQSEDHSVLLSTEQTAWIQDVLCHAARNSVDHGIEDSATRTARGKSESGVISLSSTEDHNVIVVKISDDGAGIDTEALMTNAVRRGFLSHEQASALSDQEKLDLCFLPQLSSAKTISDISGRGIGMGAIRDIVQDHGAKLDIANNPGRGFEMTITFQA